MVQCFLPHLLAQPEAAIVNVSSGLAFVPFPPAPIYSAAEAGLHAYTQVLRVQLRNTRITVVELAPPGTDTPLYHGEFAQEVASTKPMPLNVLADRAIAALAAGKVEIRPGLRDVLKFMSRAVSHAEPACKGDDAPTRMIIDGVSGPDLASDVIDRTLA